MATVAEHYENLLADYYSWTFGDFDAKVAANLDFFNYHDIAPRQSGLAVDLGAGPGFQSLPLGRLEFHVMAVDLSRKLLDELESHCGTLPVAIINDDLLNFASHCDSQVELCVCMGDTLPHLESFDRVVELFYKVYQVLETGGQFILTFRDLSFELTGPARFIPVRSDEKTVFTCFLEYEPWHVNVHDLIYIRVKERWELRKSCYRKLRLPLDWLQDQLEDVGFSVVLCECNGGMVTVICEKGK